MIRALALSVVLTCLASSALGELTDADRNAIQKGSFQGCIENMPLPKRAHFGRLAVARFCSCYASNIANTITEQQLNAMLEANLRSSEIPGYEETLKGAWRACEKHYTTKSG
jgi:hypothetical protein